MAEREATHCPQCGTTHGFAQLPTGELIRIVAFAGGIGTGAALAATVGMVESAVGRDGSVAIWSVAFAITGGPVAGLFLNERLRDAASRLRLFAFVACFVLLGGLWLCAFQATRTLGS